MRCVLGAGWLVAFAGCIGPTSPDAGVDATVDAGSHVPSDGATDAPSEPDAGCAPFRATACATGGYPSFPVGGPPALAARGEVVDDARAGLTWQRHTDGARRTLEEAAAYCDTLALEGEGDFRLPTRIELLSIVVLGASPTIDPAFAPAEPDYHWTQSVPAAFAGTSAFSVYFGAGDVAYALRDRPTAFTRCVAGEPTPRGARFVAEGAGVRDLVTGLRWASDVQADVRHDELVARCAPGRPPTLLELASIVDESRSDPAIDPVFGATSGPVWSADRDAMGPRIVDFVHGEVLARAAGDPASVRCVLE